MDKGFIVHRNLFDIANMSALLENIEVEATPFTNNGVTMETDDGRRRQKVLPNTLDLVQKIHAFCNEHYPALVPERVVVMWSLPGCQPQLPHTDYPYNMDYSAINNVAEFPVSMIVALQDSTPLDVWPYSIARNRVDEPNEIVVLNRGDAILFRVDCIHAGKGFSDHNYRLHVYLENPKIRVEPDPNRKWYLDFDWIKRVEN